VGLMPAFRYRHDQLVCDEVVLKEMADAYGTPLYVYSTNAIVEGCRAFKCALSGVDHLLTYAVKANGNPALLRLIASEGFGADVASLGELFLALKAGFAPHTITFSGVGKREDEIAYALENNVHLLEVESEQELELINALAGRLGKRAKVLLRLNLDIDAGGHNYIATSRKHDKFGMAAHRALELMKCAHRFPHVVFGGLNSHLGSQITRVDPFVEAAHKLRLLVAEFRRQGMPIHDLDFGGGFGVQYQGVVQHPSLAESAEDVAGVAAIVESVLPILKETGCRILLQPGRSIVAQAGALVVKVLYRKETDEKTFVIVDGGMNDLIRPSLYQAYHQIVPLAISGRELETVDVVGPCCETGDFFALDRSIPRTERNEYLAILCAGAYGYALSSNYNGRLRPAEVLVDGAKATVIRRRETLEDLL
jgi:diaminopimelate decarboxylase